LSINWQRNVKPKPAILVLPPGVDNLDEAHAAIEMWEHYSRKTLDSSQRLTVEVMMAERGGRWAARTTGREEPRQNGKGEEFEVVELWGIVQRAEAILHTAHELTTVSSAHQRMTALVSGHADLRRRTRKILNGIGQQLIELTNDGVIAYRTRTNGGGRGLDDISRLVVDEAQHAKPEQLASSTPILLANPNPQMNFAGTGAIDGVSDWWWELRKRALSKEPGAFGYVGHTAERVSLNADGRVVQVQIDPFDRNLWFEANPALHAGRGEIEFFEEQLRTLGPALFAREHLGVWDPEPAGVGSVIGSETWDALRDYRSEIASHRAWSLSVSLDRRWTSFATSGRRADGLLHVDTTKRAAGTEWVVDFAAEVYAGSHLPLRIHKTAPEASFIAPLRERGVEVIEVSSADVAQATGQFIDACNAGELRHLGQPALDIALKGAVLRTSTDGAALWSQRNSQVEITPLMACTIATGGVPEAVGAMPAIF
jgi:hypothetical protein